MAQWVKVSTLNPDNLSWTPHGDTWWKKRMDICKLSYDFLTCTREDTHTDTNKYTKTYF